MSGEGPGAPLFVSFYRSWMAQSSEIETLIILLSCSIWHQSLVIGCKRELSGWSWRCRRGEWRRGNGKGAVYQFKCLNNAYPWRPQSPRLAVKCKDKDKTTIRAGAGVQRPGCSHLSLSFIGLHEEMCVDGCACTWTLAIEHC